MALAQVGNHHADFTASTLDFEKSEREDGRFVEGRMFSVRGTVSAFR